ncbi:MAG: hypothetical protein A2Y74_05565 [Actinobacteria bacterium RBG_13_63_9]|nr:MAG: hypothetical protein A2Y74_05565 [Actinobacteria bacterium RBG_13_63_9]
MVLLRWVSLRGTTVCPACGTVGAMGLHARYLKYHFAISIEIQRVRCRRCGTTHALIPVFSVPGTSLGREEAERCLQDRAAGASRSRAAAELVARGWEVRVGKRLERKLATAVERGKAIWPSAAEVSLEARAWVRAVCGSSEQPILGMNRFALEHGVNAICFCRAPILLFRAAVRGGHRSHRPASAGPPRRSSRLRAMQSHQGGTP